MVVRMIDSQQYDLYTRCVDVINLTLVIDVFTVDGIAIVWCLSVRLSVCDVDGS